MAWSMRKKVVAVPEKKSAGVEVVPEPPATLEKRVGWCMALFADDCLVEDAAGLASITAIWEAYRRWCADEGLAPLAYSTFVEEFGGFAVDVGMPRRQVGGNVVFPTVKTRGE
ncbi:primase-like DNA-binding domain-containing protein [Hyphomicrobium sp. DY-1]|jgi:hypothetical protein|uniref:primase-like DNA-binding domain-containing protein n=1 Tax=Hyphomicrobium sp. DY-1 TaxID=3075650 RepID=UPI0039C2ED50